MHDWESLRSKHGNAIWKIAFRIVRNEPDAMDCFQEVFAEAIRKSRLGTLESPAGLLRWLAVRRAIDCRRRQRKLGVGSHVDERVPDRNAPGAGELIDLSELMERVRCELEGLPDHQAEAFWLCCVEEWTIDEIASVMNLQKSHVSVLDHRARKHLQKSLQDLDDGNDPPIRMHSKGSSDEEAE